MARLINETIKKELADEILFGALARGGRVRVKLNDEGDSLAFDFESRESKEQSTIQN